MESPFPPVGFIWSESGILTAVIQEEPLDPPHAASQTGLTSLVHWYLSRAQSYERFLLEVRSSRDDLQISLGRNAPPKDGDIERMYNTVQKNIIRIVRTYYFSSGLSLSLKAKTEQSFATSRQGGHGLNERTKDCCSQVSLPACGDRVELGVLRAAEAIFEMIRDNLLEPSNFRREDEATKLNESEASAQQPIGRSFS